MSSSGSGSDCVQAKSRPKQAAVTALHLAVTAITDAAIDCGADQFETCTSAAASPVGSIADQYSTVTSPLAGTTMSIRGRASAKGSAQAVIIVAKGPVAGQT